MLTYNNADEVRNLATAHGFFIKPIAMKTIIILACTNSQSSIGLFQRRGPTNLCDSSSDRRVIEPKGSQEILITAKNERKTSVLTFRLTAYINLFTMLVICWRKSLAPPDAG